MSCSQVRGATTGPIFGPGPTFWLTLQAPKQRR